MSTFHFSSFSLEARNGGEGVVLLNLLEVALAGGDWNNDSQPLYLEDKVFIIPSGFSCARNVGCYPSTT